MKRLDQQHNIIDPEKVIKNKPLMVKENSKYPDAKKHKQISFLKSAVRILGYAVLPLNLENAIILLIASEIIGIIEELV